MSETRKGSETSFKGRIWAWLYPWLKDFFEVGVTVGVIIIILKLTLGAKMLVPLVVVTSGSMTHKVDDNRWMSWMMSRGLSEGDISNFPLQSGFVRGDMIIVKNPTSNLGDVIIYERDLDHMSLYGSDPIIHRAVGVVYVKDYEVVELEGTMDCIKDKRLADTIG